MKDKFFLLTLVALLFSSLSLSSCKEDDDDTDEFPNWKARNEAYFQNLKDSVSSLIAAGNSEWKILPSFSQTHKASTDSVIIVHILESGDASTATPLFTDTVRVHYYGQLLPSTTYKNGYVFDKSYSDYTYDPATSQPYKGVVSSFVDGFTTALLNMHVDDHWKVYMPYQLAYGSSGSTTIPAYSTLIFDMQLAGIYKPGTTIPDWK